MDVDYLYDRVRGLYAPISSVSFLLPKNGLVGSGKPRIMREICMIFHRILSSLLDVHIVFLATRGRGFTFYLLWGRLGTKLRSGLDGDAPQGLGLDLPELVQTTPSCSLAVQPCGLALFLLNEGLRTSQIWLLSQCKE